MSRHRKYILGLAIGALAGLVLTFQNCAPKMEAGSAVGDSAAIDPLDAASMSQAAESGDATQRSNSSGGSSSGFDGKPYVSFGLCGAEIDVQSRIVVVSSTEGEITRKDCVDLQSPVRFSLATLAGFVSGQPEFTMNGATFVEELPGTVPDSYCVQWPYSCQINQNNYNPNLMKTATGGTRVLGPASTYAVGTNPREFMRWQLIRVRRVCRTSPSSTICQRYGP